MPEPYYGPVVKPNEPGYSEVPDRKPLAGPAKKIIYDLQRLLNIYSGIKAKIYKLNSSGTTKCTVCRDIMTGASVLSNCSTCYGTGIVPGYIYLGEYSVGLNFLPRLNVATEFGNTITNGIKEDYFSVVGVQHQLRDRDLLILKHSREVYKVVEREPEIIGLGGFLIMQVISAPLLEKGNIAYKLINW